MHTHTHTRTHYWVLDLLRFTLCFACFSFDTLIRLHQRCSAFAWTQSFFQPNEFVLNVAYFRSVYACVFCCFNSAWCTGADNSTALFIYIFFPYYWNAHALCVRHVLHVDSCSFFRKKRVPLLFSFLFFLLENSIWHVPVSYEMSV